MAWLASLGLDLSTSAAFEGNTGVSAHKEPSMALRLDQALKPPRQERPLERPGSMDP